MGHPFFIIRGRVSWSKEGKRRGGSGGTDSGKECQLTSVREEMAQGHQVNFVERQMHARIG